MKYIKIALIILILNVCPLANAGNYYGTETLHQSYLDIISNLPIDVYEASYVANETFENDMTENGITANNSEDVWTAFGPVGIVQYKGYKQALIIKVNFDEYGQNVTMMELNSSFYSPTKEVQMVNDTYPYPVDYLQTYEQVYPESSSEEGDLQQSIDQLNETVQILFYLIFGVAFIWCLISGIKLMNT